MSMGPGAGGPPWRHLRSDRSVVDNKIERRTLRRVLGFARPHRRLIEAFLAVTVVDAALVVVPPLLLKALQLPTRPPPLPPTTRLAPLLVATPMLMPLGSPSPLRPSLLSLRSSTTHLMCLLPSPPR